MPERDEDRLDAPPEVVSAEASASREATSHSRRLLIAACALTTMSLVAAILVGTSNDRSSMQSTGALPIRTSTPTVGSTRRAPTTTSAADQGPVAAVGTPTPTAATTAPTTPPTTGDVPAATPPPATAPPQDADDPAVVARPVPVDPPPPPPSAPRPPWADSTRTTSAGLLSTDVGCADDTSAAGLDRFFAERVGPVLGWDYQHVVSLGATRSLWLFQDTFVDHSGTAGTLDKASFVHNAALIEDNGCFSLLHRGTADRPAPFEPGTGTTTLSTWFWPMGGEVHDGRLHVAWVEMTKDAIDPSPPDGLGWHPTSTYIATYDPDTLARLDFRPAPNSGVAPIYGYVMESDAAHTYLFGNTFEQNLSREGGYWNGPHSATRIFLARVPRGRVFDAPQYRTADGWSTDPAAAVPILSRHWAEFPFQPRYLDGQWVGVAAVDGYWDERYSVDVAGVPWGPWTTVESRVVAPRNGDPAMNTYHAHLLPYRDATGQLVVTISNNARNMLRDAWPRPDRYRPMVFNSAWVRAPAPAQSPPVTAPPATAPPSTTTTTTTTTVPTTTTTTTTSTTTTTTVPSTTTTSTNVPTTSRTPNPAVTSTPTTAPPTTADAATTTRTSTTSRTTLQRSTVSSTPGAVG